jgi:hypothetical protein
MGCFQLRAIDERAFDTVPMFVKIKCVLDVLENSEQYSQNHDKNTNIHEPLRPFRHGKQVQMSLNE